MVMTKTEADAYQKALSEIVTEFKEQSKEIQSMPWVGSFLEAELSLQDDPRNLASVQQRLMRIRQEILGQITLTNKERAAVLNNDKRGVSGSSAQLALRFTKLNLALKHVNTLLETPDIQNWNSYLDRLTHIKGLIDNTSLMLRNPKVIKKKGSTKRFMDFLKGK